MAVWDDDLVRDRWALEREFVQTRRALHQRPELSLAEHKTAALVISRLRALGLQPRSRVGETGVIADLEGDRPGPTLLLRADMDALPIDEIAGRSYGSQVRGVMHACGHDAHTSSLLGVARLLCARRDLISGRIRLFFQPAEETAHGARAMIEDGALDGVDEALAAHVSSTIPFGAVAVRAGQLLAGADLFELTITGGGGHAALSEQSRDAVFASAQLITALQSIVARETSPASMLVLSIASIQGGTAANVTARDVTMRGTLRWSVPDVRAHALTRIAQIADGVCGALRVTHQLRVRATVPPLHCAAPPAALLNDAANASHGITTIDPGVLAVADDFALICELVPAAYCLVGAAGPRQRHAPRPRLRHRRTRHRPDRRDPDPRRADPPVRVSAAGARSTAGPHHAAPSAPQRATMRPTSRPTRDSPEHPRPAAPPRSPLLHIRRQFHLRWRTVAMNRSQRSSCGDAAFSAWAATNARRRSVGWH